VLCSAQPFSFFKGAMFSFSLGGKQLCRWKSENSPKIICLGLLGLSVVSVCSSAFDMLMFDLYTDEHTKFAPNPNKALKVFKKFETMHIHSAIHRCILLQKLRCKLNLVESKECMSPFF
jgi:hypothetical protein